MKEDHLLKKFGRRLRRALLPVMIVGLGVLVFAYLLATKSETKKIEVTEKAWPVAAMSVQLGAWQPQLELYGSIDALSYAHLSAALEADVVAVTVIEGSRVRAGEELIRLDDRDARLDVAQRQADVKLAEAALQTEASRHQADVQVLPQERRLYRLAQAELDRLKNLKSKKLSSQSALDSANQAVARQAIAIARIEENIRNYASKKQDLEARLERARAALQKAELQLQRTLVLAPFDGWVTRVLVAPGHRVNKGSRLLEMYDRESLVVRALIPERYLRVVEAVLDQGGRLKFESSLQGQRLSGELVTLGGELFAGKGGVDALFRIIRKPPGLVKGKVLQLRLMLPPQQDVLAVPYEAIYGSDKVYLIDADDRLQPLKVERVGQLWVDDQAQVLVRAAKLANGQRLLATQLPNAIAGLKVRVVDHHD